MQDTKIISGTTEETVWEQIEKNYPNEILPSVYHVTLEQQGRHILLDIDESSSMTTFSSYLYNRSNFRFAICPQGLMAEVGKFFGMEDIVLGYPEFDEKYIIRTNDEEKTAVMFADPSIRNLLQSIPDLTLRIVEYTLEDGDGKAPFLELKINGLVNELIVLKNIYKSFYKILTQVES